MAVLDSNCFNPQLLLTRECPLQAEELILHGFPEKIVKLNELLELPLFVPLELGSVHQKLNIPTPDPVHINR